MVAHVGCVRRGTDVNGSRLRRFSQVCGVSVSRSVRHACRRRETHDSEQPRELTSPRCQIADRMPVEFLEERIARLGKHASQTAVGLDHAMPVRLAFIGETTDYRKIVFRFATELSL